MTGTLSLGGHDQAIIVAQLSPRSVYTGEYERLHRDTAHRSLLIVCTGDRPGMGLLNAERFRHPYGAPTIHVSSDASDVVLAGATRAVPARVVAESRYIPAPACNAIFTANSGHELGHLGLDDFMARRSGWERRFPKAAPPGYISALTSVP